MEEETVGLEAGLEAGTAGEEALEVEPTAGAAGAAAAGAAAAATVAHEQLERSGAPSTAGAQWCTGLDHARGGCEICAAPRMVLGAEAEAELQHCIELANTWGGRSGPSMATS